MTEYTIRLIFEGGAPQHVHLNFADTGPVLDAINQLGASMAADLTALTTAVANEGTVIQSAIVLLNGLAEQIRNTVDPADLQALADSVDAQASSLAAAVTADTPSA